jgi:hypothetical protein
MVDIWSVKMSDGLTEHNFWDIECGEERLILVSLIYFIQVVEIILGLDITSQVKTWIILLIQPPS